MQGFVKGLSVILAMSALSVPAFAADAKTIATFTLAIGGQDPAHVATADVSVQETGDLVISTQNYVDNGWAPASPIVKTLAPNTFQTLKTKIEALSIAEISTVHSDVVCEMMPLYNSGRILSVRRGFDWQSQAFTGDLAVVDNNAGCWELTHIQPKETYDQTTAKALESALEVLTLEATQR
jgi:hypothetical protein